MSTTLAKQWGRPVSKIFMTLFLEGRHHIVYLPVITFYSCKVPRHLRNRSEKYVTQNKMKSAQKATGLI